MFTRAVRHNRFNGIHAALAALAAAGLALGASGCKKSDEHHPGEMGADPTLVPGGNVPHGPARAEPVAGLDDDLEVQPARTTADARLPQPWTDITPTAAADAGAKGPIRTWTAPTVLIGRRQVWLSDKSIAPVHCRAKDEASCQPEALRGPSGSARFGFAAEQLRDGKLAALADAAAALKDKEVAVIADRRVTWQAVETVLATLRAAGARPTLAAGGFDGELVDVLGIGSGRPEAADLTAARRQAEPTESAGGGLPSDATALTVEISPSGLSLEVGRAAGEPVRPEVMGNVVESLIAIGERLRRAAPAIDTVTLRVDPDVPMEEVVRAVDGLRDDCGRSGRGQRCTQRTQLFAHIAIVVAGAAVEPAKADAGGALHLDAAPAPGGLHLSDKPATGAAPGLRLAP